jgi:hypothetical protein
LQGGDAQVHQDAAHARDAQVVEHPGQFVVHRVHQPDPVAETGQTTSGQFQCLGVSIEADQLRLRAGTQQRLAVSAHSQGQVDDDGAGRLQSGGQEGDTTVPHHRDVPLGRVRRMPGIHW